MNSQSYDAVCALSLHDEDHQEDASGGALDKLKGGVQAVMAAGRLDTQIYGRRWNDLTPEGQRRIAAEKREQRLQKQREQRQREAERVTFGDVAETMRKNSVVGLDELRRRLSHSGTDLSKVDGEMVWSKAWLLTPEASQPDLVPGARYHNRRRSGFVTQEQLLEIGVVYMKLPTTSLDKLNALCDERGYCEMTKDTLTGNAACLNEWYSEKYNTVEYAIFVQSGACFVDVRDENHEFVRVELGEGDLLILPPGIFHRCTLDQSESVEVLRCYRGVGETVHRDKAQTQHEQRAAYLASRKRGSVLEDNMFVAPH